jgi:XTP/dITP diphosphohydrolase
MATGRIVLVPFSPRVAPGLVSAAVWRLLTEPGVRVHAGSEEHPVLDHLDDVDVEIELIEGEPGEVAAELLGEAEAGQTAVWLADPTGEQELVRALGRHLSGGGEIELELLPGSYDLPGAKLMDVVAVMDRLRGPGGCPWDAEQTHQSLVKYLLEEAYETVEAIEDGNLEDPGEDRDALREELGDLLFQAVFHARIAQEHQDDPFGIDEVAEGIAQKLISRHPHVFAGVEVDDAADVEANWERLKAVEKGRTSAVQGVPMAQPALSLADKLLKRAATAGVPVTVTRLPTEIAAEAADRDGIGRLLLAVAAHARSLGVDPEEALRARARGLREEIMAGEGSH